MLYGLLQKLLRMRAALSDSMSSVVGQNASEPTLLERRLTGAPSLSTQLYTLSNPALDCVFVFDQRAMVWFGCSSLEQKSRGWCTDIQEGCRRGLDIEAQDIDMHQVGRGSGDESVCKAAERKRRV